MKARPTPGATACAAPQPDRRRGSVLGDARVDSDIARVGRTGTAHDIAPAILFFFSNAARWIKGVNLPVDGWLEASVAAAMMGF